MIKSSARAPARHESVPLIEPSEPSAPGSVDNVNGDLIVYGGSNIADPEGRVYLMKRRIGCGHFGQVYEVVLTNPDSGDAQTLAMKISKSDPGALGQFQYESQAMEFISTSLIDPLFVSSFIFKGHFCIVLQLLGPSLLDELDSRGYQGLPLDRVQMVLSDVLRYLSALAQLDLVHCDVKPENILSEKDSPRTRLIDFGSCCVVGDPDFVYVQSRYYRAPEVVLQLPFDSQADVWSLGCVAAELMLGLPLFPALDQMHLLILINEMLGPFPEEMTQNSDYFLPNGSMKSEETLCREFGTDFSSFQRYFVQTKLDDIVMSFKFEEENPEKERENRRIFLDLLHKMLEIDPQKRTTPEEALLHPFLKIKF